MEYARAITAFAACIAIAACSQSDSGADEPEPEPVETQTAAEPLEEASIGPVQYSYDPAALTRAEISLPLPPDMEESTFAVKFIPADLVDNLGSVGCSYTDDTLTGGCGAEEEIGFALAFLERPIDTYGDALFDDLDETMTVEFAEIDGHEGFTLQMPDGETQMRYTYLPVKGRTLLLVDRKQADVTAGAVELAQVRESLRFPDD